MEHIRHFRSGACVLPVCSLWVFSRVRNVMKFQDWIYYRGNGSAAGKLMKRRWHCAYLCWECGIHESNAVFHTAVYLKLLIFNLIII
jgi:hypothetical protein